MYTPILPFCLLRDILRTQLGGLLKFHIFLQKRAHEITAAVSFKVIQLSVAYIPNISLDPEPGSFLAAAVQAALCDHFHRKFFLPSALMIISAAQKVEVLFPYAGVEKINHNSKVFHLKTDVEHPYTYMALMVSTSFLFCYSSV